MTPRYQKILFVVLFVASVTMTAVLVRLRERAHDRLLAGAMEAGTTAPAVAPLEQVTLMVADDATSTLAPETIALPLPEEPQARARAVLNRLLSQYSGAQSLHPLPTMAEPVESVFLMPVPQANGDARRAVATGDSGRAGAAGGAILSVPKNADRIAIVNLADQFAASHPSGLETETLTVLSICATLHANLPEVTEVRFLVGGQERATLHGHADLTQTYLTAASAAASGAQP